MKTNDTTTIENLKERLLKDIKQLNWDINYYESKLAESKLKMQVLEYGLTHLTSQEYANVQPLSNPILHR